MFELLRSLKITQESIDVMVEKELPYFQELLRRCCGESESPDDALDLMCGELGFAKDNPGLLKAVKACAYGVAGELEGEVSPAGAEWRGAMCGVAGLLAALRLIDRALEARELEERLGG